MMTERYLNKVLKFSVSGFLLLPPTDCWGLQGEVQNAQSRVTFEILSSHIALLNLMKSIDAFPRPIHVTQFVKTILGG